MIIETIVWICIILAVVVLLRMSMPKKDLVTKCQNKTQDVRSVEE